MTEYKKALCDAMKMLALDEQVVFCGYGLLHGRAGGTLADIPNSKILELPTSENLMMGVAIGLSLKGKKPLVYVERADFLLNMLDAIVNHLAAMGKLSRDEFNPTCIIRVTIGNSLKPLFTGPVHTQDLTDAMRHTVAFPVRWSEDACEIEADYHCAYRDFGKNSTMIFEQKDRW